MNSNHKVTNAFAERLPQEELHRRFVRALGPGATTWHSDFAAKPFEADFAPPLPHHVRIYMYNATRPPGGRPLGEHKMQLIAPGQRRNQRGSFDHGGGRIVLLIGYAVDEDVFVLWDAGLYNDFAWSRNVQVRAETIVQASAGKIASQDRILRPANSPPALEIVLAAKSHRLAEAVCRRMEMTRNRLING